ncbi:3248_t:CDS:2 [Paraglomus brasilianum]|uniref:3248_t:CDS:1 n=1 Tax=Paraglomus brasilianum TaxID=144538 RepID=A0A9N9A4I7_9GLOM|nr:3248_t:CDS:2 [Paraglomus brasilianum]
MFINHLTRSSRRLLPYGIRHVGTVAKQTEPILFNRQREIDYFKKRFKSKVPGLHIILGPPSTGKTALMRKVVSDAGMNPLLIDLRSGQCDTPMALYYSIIEQYKTFYDKLKTLSKSVKAVNMASYEIQFNELTSGVTAGTAVTRLLCEISSRLPQWRWWSSMDVPPPILVIDEANRFDQLSEVSPESTSVIQTFLQWMVLNTKQEQKFHIILTSSDSFFINWIRKYINHIHFKPYVVGDLSKENAEEFFEEHVLMKSDEPSIRKELTGQFHHIHRITGTRMFLIKQYVDQYSVQGKFEDCLFDYYLSAYDQLQTGLYPETLKGIKPAPAWQQDDFIKAMRFIVKNADQGFVAERDLIREIGPEKLLSLVHYNFLHRRPTPIYTFDIVNPPNEPILTPMSQPALRAMEDLLKMVDGKA